ncbi:MAG: DUF4337 family protein [Pseudomonadota bacterium]
MSDAAPTEHFEHTEHAEHAAHSGDPFLAIVAITIAILAVIAAFIGSLETIETAATIDAKNEAVLYQDKATDTWNFYQAKSFKKNLYETAAVLAGAGANADNFKALAKKNGDDQQSIQLQAKTEEDMTEQKLRSSEKHEHRHQILTVAVTLLHISIAIATIAIVRPGTRWPWYTALGLGALGCLGAAFAYI